MGVGYDRLDRDALAKRAVTVCNVPGSLLLYPLNLSRTIEENRYLLTQSSAYRLRDR